MVQGSLIFELGIIAIGLQKVLDLLPRDKHFPEAFATGQETARQQPAHGFGAYIQGRRRLVNVVNQRLRERGRRCGLGRFFGVNLERFHVRFFVVYFTP